MDNRTALYVMQSFQQMGYSPEASAAITGNLAAESKLNPNATGDNGTSHGIAQWHNERWRMMNDWTRQRGYDPNSLDGQIKYLDWELKTRYTGVYNTLKTTRDLKTATAAFTTGFERPAGSQNGAEASAGWGSRLGHAMTFASLATGKPMSDFAATGYVPPGAAGIPGAAGTEMAQQPAEAMPQEVAVAPPEPAMAEGMGDMGGGGGSPGGDMSDLSDLEAAQTDATGTGDQLQGSTKIAQQWKANKGSRIDQPQSLSSVFQLPNIGQAPVMNQQRMQKFGKLA
jgi:hypothetical protein